MSSILLSIILLVIGVILLVLAFLLVTVTGPREFIALITISIVLFITAFVIQVLPKGSKQITSLVSPSSNVEALDFFNGKRLEKNLSLFFLISSVILVLTMLFVKFPTLGKLAFSVVFGGIAFFAYSNLKKINTLVDTRKKIYNNGTPVTATVTSHSRKSVFYTSTPTYGITVKTDDMQQKTITFFYSNETLHNSCPEGSTIKGLEYKGDYFFGEMIGVKLDLADKNDEIRIQN